MLIRNATLDDIPAITTLMNDLGYPTNEADVRSRFENIIPHSDHKTLLTIDDKGQAVGMIGMTKNYYYEHNGQYIRILAMVVAQQHQNKGIGKLLMQQAEEWAYQINAQTVILTSGNRPERDKAYSFYQKLGYEIKSSGFVKVLK